MNLLFLVYIVFGCILVEVCRSFMDLPVVWHVLRLILYTLTFYVSPVHVWMNFYGFIRTVSLHHAVLRFAHAWFPLLWGHSIWTTFFSVFTFMDILTECGLVLGDFHTMPIFIVVWAMVRMVYPIWAFSQVNGLWDSVGLFLMLTIQMYLFQYFVPFIKQYQKQYGTTLFTGRALFTTFK